MPILTRYIAQCTKCGEEELMKDDRDMPHGWPDLPYDIVLCPSCTVEYRKMRKKIKEIEKEFWENTFIMYEIKEKI